jgi:arylsulfatase A-like enzyme
MLPDGVEGYYVHLEKRESMPYEALEEQMRGYHASITFLDVQLGRVMDALEEVRMTNDLVPHTHITRLDTWAK